MITETELILTRKGRIYHLDLVPEEIPDTIITVGDPGRVKQVSKYFDRVLFKRVHREFVSHIGELGSLKLMVISTGIGTDNIDIVLNEIDALVNIDFNTRQIKQEKRSLRIIRIGTSGTIRSDIEIDSLLISKYAIGLDALMGYYQKNIKTIPRLIIDQINNSEYKLPENAYWGRADKSLLELFSSPYFRQGITITCPGFYGPQGRSLRMPSTNFEVPVFQKVKYEGLKITNLEMETAAIYAMANSLGHKAISLNAILANRMESKFSKNPSFIIEKLIKIALDALIIK